MDGILLKFSSRAHLTIILFFLLCLLRAVAFAIGGSGFSRIQAHLGLNDIHLWSVAFGIGVRDKFPSLWNAIGFETGPHGAF